MDILLTHGYFIAEDAHEQVIMKPYPTLGLLYISSHLKQKGFDVALFDSTFEDMASFRAYVLSERPGVVGIYCNLMTKHNVLVMIAICRRAGATVILGGPEPISYAAEYLEAGAHIIVGGEGEETLEELLPHLARYGMRNLSTIRGIAFRGDDGRVARTAPRTQIQDLDAQPWPDRDAIPMQRYLDTWREHHGLSSVSLITARGCPYTCTWCSHTVFGHTHRRRSPESVVEEVAWIKETYAPDQLWYADDVFTIAHRWFLEFADALRQRDLCIPFECISRADRLNEQIIDALASIGCYRLWIGSESGSQRILDRMERKAQVDDIQAKTGMLQRRGINVGMFIMLGYEGEEIADLRATVDHLKQASPDVFLTTVAYPIKGTPYYEEVQDRLIADPPWEHRTDRDLGVRGRHSARFYDHATRWMVNEVRLHQARHNGDAGPLEKAKMALNAGRGWLGMRLTRHEQEMDGSGRGWETIDRAADGW
jgi:anaerobic magnesium-protoporphyrin IX monomethyl ester cyclase